MLMSQQCNDHELQCRMESVHIQLATTASRCECQRKQKWRPLLRPRIWSHQMTSCAWPSAPSGRWSCAVVRWLPVFWPVDRRRSLALMGRKAVMRLACLRKSPCSRSSPRVVVAFLMYQGRSLSEAVDQVTRCRGRRLRINPSFWMVPR
ncbi:unnamed protein product, partial [Durusdinium trenchii]